MDFKTISTQLIQYEMTVQVIITSIKERRKVLRITQERRLCGGIDRDRQQEKDLHIRGTGEILTDT